MSSETCASGSDVKKLEEQQTQVQGILEERAADLETLKTTADRTAFQQTREAQIKKNDRERSEVVAHSAIVFSVAAGVVLVCLLVRYFLPAVPLAATTAAMMIAFFGAAVMIARDVLLLASRDRSNFQELALAPPSPSTAVAAAATVGADPGPEEPPGAGGDGTCAPADGSAFCDNVTNKWDPVAKKCIPLAGTAELFTQVHRAGHYTVPPTFNPRPCRIDIGKYE